MPNDEKTPPSDSVCEDLDELLWPVQLGLFGNPETQRRFIKQVAGTSAAIAGGANFLREPASAEETTAGASPATSNRDSAKVNLKINGKEHALDVDPRAALGLPIVVANASRRFRSPKERSTSIQLKIGVR